MAAAPPHLAHHRQPRPGDQPHRAGQGTVLRGVFFGGLTLASNSSASMVQVKGWQRSL
jgi:hypothetical protein